MSVTLKQYPEKDPEIRNQENPKGPKVKRDRGAKAPAGRRRKSPPTPRCQKAGVAKGLGAKALIGVPAATKARRDIRVRGQRPRIGPTAAKATADPCDPESARKLAWPKGLVQRHLLQRHTRDAGGKVHRRHAARKLAWPSEPNKKCVASDRTQTELRS